MEFGLVFRINSNLGGGFGLQGLELKVEGCRILGFRLRKTSSLRLRTEGLGGNGQ